MKKIVLSLVLMLFVSGSAVFAQPHGGPHGGMHHAGPMPMHRPMHGPAIPPPPPVMHGRPHIPVGVIPTRHPRVFVGARINPYYYADCINPMGYYDPYYCGTYYAPGVVRFSLPRAGITVAF
ncbi:MAG: hypothetical protein NC390_00610 [Fusobacterium sp.]|nr:hypothetical protein [Fusobacterium sp.]